MTNRHRTRRPRPQRGFTLIEIMAVVVIMGLLMGIVGTAVFSQIDKARVNTTRAQIDQLEAALTFYQMDNGRFPTTEQGLQALVEQPTSAPEPRNYNAAGYLKKRQVPPRRLGQPLSVRDAGRQQPGGLRPLVAGADGQPGGTGNDADLGNWLEPDEGAYDGPCAARCARLHADRAPRGPGHHRARAGHHAAEPVAAFRSRDARQRGGSRRHG